MRRLIAVLLLLCAPHARSQSPAIMTSSGPVIGVTTNGVTSYKGIPYAAPPVDSLRWRAPRPPIRWSTPFPATQFGASCMQALPVKGTAAGTPAATTSEDCLTLNIWTPASHSRPLPVMIWIYGGANIEGTSGRAVYDGTHFARDSVILVSLNYRLGIFGFFVDDLLAREAGSAPTGNFGLLDQLAAIRWVHRNIAEFGGDTSNVTLFGESAGGQDVVALLAGDALNGLVQRAIIESPGGGWSGPVSRTDAIRIGNRLTARLAGGSGATLGQLRRVSATALLDDPANSDAGPMVDGKLLGEKPLDAFANGRALKVPIVIGTNSDDGSLIAGILDPFTLFQRILDPTAIDSLRTLYGAAAADRATLGRLIFRDAYFAGPVRWIADHQAPRAPTWLYRFDYVVTPFRAARPGASHGSEIPFVFETWPIPLMIPADKAIDDAMHSCWVTFAKSGAPDCAGLPGWTTHTPGEGKLMLINDHPSMRADPAKAVLDLMQRRFRH